jgi:hypothetical protein
MKKTLVLLPFMLVAAVTSFAQSNCPVNAGRFMRKMQLRNEEMYYVSKGDFFRKYAQADKTLEFPCNEIYNRDGRLVLIEAGQGKRFPLLTCFQLFASDLDSFMHEAKFYKHVTDTSGNAWMKQHVKQAYDTPEQTPGAYNFVLYYPAGMPMVRKRYAALVKRIRYYQQQGQDMRIYFVLVPVRDKKES